MLNKKHKVLLFFEKKKITQLLTQRNEQREISFSIDTCIKQLYILMMFSLFIEGESKHRRQKKKVNK